MEVEKNLCRGAKNLCLGGEKPVSRLRKTCIEMEKNLCGNGVTPVWK